METTKKTDENGKSYSTNWMLDNVIEAFEKRGINKALEELLESLLLLQLF